MHLLYSLLLFLAASVTAPTSQEGLARKKILSVPSVGTAASGIETSVRLSDTVGRWERFGRKTPGHRSTPGPGSRLCFHRTTTDVKPGICRPRR
jgi:hypothetical protein